MYFENIRRTRHLSYLLIIAMVFSILSGFNAVAAKKPALNHKKLSIYEGRSKRIKVKNASAKAKVTWKTSKKSIAKIAKKKTKGKRYEKKETRKKIQEKRYKKKTRWQIK